MSPELEAALAKSKEWYDNASPAERAAMWKAQLESFIRAEAPCEHGNPDWDECTLCYPELAKTRGAVMMQRTQDGIGHITGLCQICFGEGTIPAYRGPARKIVCVYCRGTGRAAALKGDGR